MLCGCFASSVTGNLQRVEGKIDSLKYKGILGENIIPSWRKLELGCHLTLQKDNNPKHTSNSTKAWLQKKSWKILKWPSQLPDLNPIENLWWDLKAAMQQAKPRILLNCRPSLMRNGLRFLRNAARSWCLVIHLICSRS